MREVELTTKQRHQLYQRLMAAIFGLSVEDSDPPFCYPYILDGEGKAVSLEEEVKRVLGTLPNFRNWTGEDQVRLLSLRFGLEDGKPRILEEVGREFELTRERIRQVEIRTLRILRHPSRSRHLQIFLTIDPTEIREELQRLTHLEKENRELREENERLQNFIRRWGVNPEEFKENQLLRSLAALRKALKKVVFRYSYPNHLLTRVYNGLTRSGITSLSQLKALVAYYGEEALVGKMHYLGQKSRRFIHRVLEMIEEEAN